MRHDRILLIHAAADWSTADVSSGYSAAFRRAGVTVYDWQTANRLKYVSRGLGLEAKSENLSELARHVSRMVTTEVIEFEPDWVVIVSGMSWHPAASVLLHKLGVKQAIVFTESPYSHEDEAYLAQFCDVVATNDGWAAQREGWLHLPPAFDPARHRPREPGERHDVVITGTGWDERINRLAAVDWQGIDLRIFGFWPQLQVDDADAIDFLHAAGLHENPAARDLLAPYVEHRVTDNDETANLYAGARICYNDHRLNPYATSANPRVYEVLAVGGGLLLTDYRTELEPLLGSRWREFVFKDAAELGEKVRYYLSHETERLDLVAYGQERVQGETFDARVATLLERLERVSHHRGTLVAVS